MFFYFSPIEKYQARRSGMKNLCLVGGKVLEFTRSSEVPLHLTPDQLLHVEFVGEGVYFGQTPDYEPPPAKTEVLPDLFRTPKDDRSIDALHMSLARYR